jgi:hypothetical protein
MRCGVPSPGLARVPGNEKSCHRSTSQPSVQGFASRAFGKVWRDPLTQRPKSHPGGLSASDPSTRQTDRSHEGRVLAQLQQTCGARATGAFLRQCRTGNAARGTQSATEPTESACAGAWPMSFTSNSGAGQAEGKGLAEKIDRLLAWMGPMSGCVTWKSFSVFMLFWLQCGKRRFRIVISV